MIIMKRITKLSAATILCIRKLQSNVISLEISNDLGDETTKETLQQVAYKK